MFDFLRNLTKSDEERRSEQLNAYLDGELSAAEQTSLEAELSRNMALRVEMEQLRQVKRGVQELPRVRAPRNYTLDPAVYGAPARRPAWQFYPALRTATVLAAFLLVLAIGLDLVVPAGFVSNPPLASFGRGGAEVQEVASEEVPVSGEAVSVTTAATELAEGVIATEEVEMAAQAAEMAPPSGGGGAPEEPAEEPAAVEAPAEEAAADTAIPAATATLSQPALAAPATAEALAESAAATLPAPNVEDEETLRGVAPSTATAAAVEAAEAETEKVAQPSPVLVIVEIALGAVLLLLLAATLFLRRRLS